MEYEIGQDCPVPLTVRGRLKPTLGIAAVGVWRQTPPPSTRLVTDGSGGARRPSSKQRAYCRGWGGGECKNGPMITTSAAANACTR